MATPKFTIQRARAYRNQFHGTQCCGMAEFSGLDSVYSASDAAAVRRGAYLARKAGGVVITVTNAQMDRRPDLYGYLREAGFRKANKFVNPNTGNTVLIMTANTLRRTPPQ